MRPVSSNLNTTATPAQHSPWHSPVPYLFGGLAAMLGLIAFALLILACSYWKLSGYLENGDGNERDVENANEKPINPLKMPTNLEAKVVVIMAGDEKPTYLATPISSRASSFGDNSNKGGEKTEKETEKEETQNQETVADANQNQNM